MGVFARVDGGQGQGPRLSHRVSPDQEAVWGLVVGVLALHGTRAGIAPPRGEFEGPTAFRDAAYAYATVLRNRLAAP